MSSVAERRGRRPARSIAWPIFALVIASVVAATAILFAVTFSGPPPMVPARPLEAIADTLAERPPSTMAYRPPPPFLPDDANRRDPPADGEVSEPLTMTRSATTPEPGWREKTDDATGARIAGLLGAARGDVIAYTMLPPCGGGRDLFGSFTIGWRTGDQWRVVRSPALPTFTRWHANTLLANAIAVLALSIPAWALARAISRPLARLADAADRAGTGAPLPGLPGGSREVRELACAVSTMHARLAGHAESRTAMLGAIAHDLGTPLARLAFRIEQLPDAAREKAVADLDEMRAMIADTLRFARDDIAPRDETRVDLSSLLDSLAEDMAVGGAPVTLVPGPRAMVRGDAGALRRLFGNLVDNALRYGDAAGIGWTIVADTVVVTVTDEGPGVAAAQAERLFEPFVRGDPSRNRATGGTGLGLAIVRSIATRHGGTATLATHPAGRGTVATVTLPLAR